jgi:hypothetical protein
MASRDIFVITPYSPSIKKEWLHDCRASVKEQTYPAKHILIPDILKKGACCNHFESLRSLTASEESNTYGAVVIHLDGDDCFLSRYAVEKIVNEYDKNPNLVATYGNYVSTQGSICRETLQPPRETIVRGGWAFSHPRTFLLRYAEFLREEDMKDSKGNWFSSAADVAIFCPILEMAGKDRVKFIEEPLVYYRIHSGNDHANRDKLNDQVRCAVEIFQKPNYKIVYA